MANDSSPNQPNFIALAVLALVMILGAFHMILFKKGHYDDAFAPEKIIAGAGISEQQIEAIVEKFILENGEMVIQSVENYQNNARKNQMAQAEAYLEQNMNAIANNPNDPMIGNPDADITIVEFFDYACGYCKRATPSITKLIEDDGNLKLVFKEFPILGSASELSAQAALAGYQLDKDKYFTLHLGLMAMQGKKNKSNILKVAEAAGYDKAEIEKKMYTAEVMETIEQNRQLARDIGISGTPAFIFGNRLVPGAIPLEEMKRQVAEIREESQQ